MTGPPGRQCPHPGCDRTVTNPTAIDTRCSRHQLTAEDGADPTPTDEPVTVKHRTVFLAQTTELTDREVATLAWRELGFSSTGIAVRTGYTQATITRHLHRIAAQYGLSAIETTLPADQRSDALLQPVTRADVDALAPSIATTWARLAAAHPAVAPGWAAEYLPHDSTADDEDPPGADSGDESSPDPHGRERADAHDSWVDTREVDDR